MQFVNQKIAILGLGLETNDFLSWLNTKNHHCQITIFDEKVTGAKVVTKLPQTLQGFDVIVRSPGFYRFHPLLIDADKRHIPVTSVVKLFFSLCPCPIIGVTGSKGKGTTTTLIHKILKQSGKSTYIAGNIGKPMLALLPKLKANSLVCLELSSFQLQDLHLSPHLAVVLNITSEHLDVHLDTEEYRQAKTNILKFQTPKDLAVINADFPFTRALTTKAKVNYFSKTEKIKGAYVSKDKIILNLNKPITIGSTDKLLLRGKHNWENITAAITASALMGADIASITKTVFSFKGLKHRLQLIKDVNGVKYYNDSFSTTPETAIAALQAFTEPMTIILGGSDKGSDFTDLGRAIVEAKNLRSIILIGQMAEKIEQAIVAAGGFSGNIIKNLTNMTTIVKAAQDNSKTGDVVILSPACASFGMFANYKDRGDQFIKSVCTL